MVEEEQEKQAEISLDNFTKDEFWAEIVAKKMVTIGCPIEFQTVASNLIPNITNETIEVVSDKVAKLEYTYDKVDGAPVLVTFGDFKELMRVSDTWKDFKGDKKWLGLGADVTILFEQDVSQYKANEKANDITVKAWRGNVEQRLDDPNFNVRSYSLTPIPLDRLFLNTYTAGMRWHMKKGYTTMTLIKNIENWNVGKRQRDPVEDEDESDITLQAFLEHFDAEALVNGSHAVRVPEGDPQFVLTIPKLDMKMQLVKVPKLFIKKVEDGETVTKAGDFVYDVFYEQDKPISDVEKILSELIKIFSTVKPEEATELLIHNQIGNVQAEVFFNKYLKIINQSGGGTLVKEKGSVFGKDLIWKYTTNTSKITYTIRFSYDKGDTLLRNESAISIEHEGKIYPLNNNSAFFNEYVQVKESKSKKSYSFGFKSALDQIKWWKTVVPNTKSGKGFIKNESFESKLRGMGFMEKETSKVDYWSKTEFKVNDSSEYWKNYWKEMGF